MRHLALALALCLAACGSDPATASPDASTADATPDAPPSDVVAVTDAPAEAAAPDVSAPEAAVDVALDVPASDVADASDVAADTPADVTSLDVVTDALGDVAAVDVPPGECASVERACRVNADCAMCTPVRGMAWCCGGIGGRTACVVPNSDGTCPGVVTDAGPATRDVRVSCEEIVRCTRHEDCWAMCADNPAVSQWCCGASGVCGVTSSGSCMR